MTLNRDRYDRVPADGGDGPVNEELLSQFKTELDTLSAVGARVAVARVESDEARFCVWPGQKADGRKWSQDSEWGSESPVEPFDGATDARVPLVDQVTNERKMMKVLAALRASAKVKPMGPDDDRKAARVEALLRWLTTNKWGSRYVLELTRLADFVESDHPAAAVMGVYWRRTYGLRMEAVTLDALVARYVEMVTEEMAGDELELEARLEDVAFETEQMVAAVGDPDREEEAAEWVMGFFPHVTERRARKVVRELRDDGVARFPLRVVTHDEPEVVAHRIFEDVFMPVTTRWFEDAPLYFTAEILTRSELEERVVSEGYNRKWVDLVVGKEGESEGQAGVIKLPQYARDDTGGVAPVEYKDRYQIFHARFKATNSENVSGHYVVTFHAQVEGTAYGRRMEDYPHGGYPGVFFYREAISNRLLDSRSVGNIIGPLQALAKLGHDTAGNIAQFALPPFTSYGRGAARIRLKPLEENRLPRSTSELKFMQPPSTNGTHQVEVWIRRVEALVDQYWGRPTEQVPAAVVALHQECAVLSWLASLRDVLRLVVQYCQMWLPEEVLHKVTDEAGERIIESRDDIAGEYDVELAFEPRDLDLDYLEKKAKLYSVILNSLDNRQTVERAAVVRALMFAVDGSLANVAVQDVSRADEREVEDERKNFLELAAGLDVPMVEEGQNFELRLRVMQQIAEQTPAAIQALPPERQEAIMRRMEHLEFMVRQHTEHAQAGRVGVKA